MIVTRKAIPRRTILRGLGATVALPMLDAMVPAFGRALAAPRTSRLSTVYVGNGANMKTWTPATEGASYELTPMLEPLATFRDRMLVISGLDNKPGLALPGEPAGGHGRIGGSFLTGVHVKPTEGADFHAGVSIDQIAARELGQHTELASLELSLETTEFAGACDAGFSCAYTTTLCWSGPTSPLPMEHDPRAVFERLFGDSGSTDRADRQSRLAADRSILDSVTSKLARMQRNLGSRDREKLEQYVEAIRDAERRIQRAEEQSARELPVVEQPAGAPDGFEAYARLMFDLQVLAFQSDLTRVSTFVLAPELSARTYPEAGVADPHHAISHHQNRADNLEKIAKIGAYHSKVVSYYLERLQSTSDGEGSLLDHTNVIYGRGMSDSNAHQPIGLPLVVVSRELGGGQHVRYQGVPLTNLYMTLLANLGVPVERIGDSTGKLVTL
jgi:Protein of unknown function (DUF1552)